MNKLKYLKATAAAICIASPLVAQPFEPWREVNEWNIIFNEATSGCFMEHETPEGFVLHIGTTDDMWSGAADDRAYFVGFYAPEDGGFAPTQDVDIEIASGPDSFVGTAHELPRDGYHGWWSYTNNDNLIDDLLTRKTMTVSAEDGGTAFINLFQLGIDDAFAQLVECQLMRG